MSSDLMTLPVVCFIGGSEEIHQDWGKDIGRDVVPLAREDSVRGVGHDLRQGFGRIVHESTARSAVHDERWRRDRSRRRKRHCPIAKDRVIVGESRRHRLQGWPEWRLAHPGYLVGR